jgi:hypothetical protein
MPGVKVFGVSESDGKTVAIALQEAFLEWHAENAHSEILTAQTTISYDPDDRTVHGVMTVLYREP